MNTIFNRCFLPAEKNPFLGDQQKKAGGLQMEAPRKGMI